MGRGEARQLRRVEGSIRERSGIASAALDADCIGDPIRRWALRNWERLAYYYLRLLRQRDLCPFLRTRRAMLEYPYDSHSFLTLHHPHAVPVAPDVLDDTTSKHHPHLPAPPPPSPPVSVSDPDSPPSALSAATFYSASYEHRRSVSFTSSPPTSAPAPDDPRGPRVAVDDPQFAYSAPAAHHSLDRRASEPHVAARFRHQPHPSAQAQQAYLPPLSSSFPTPSFAGHQYSPRPSSSYTYPANSGPWEDHSQEGPLTTTPVDSVAHGLAMTATSAALASSGGLPLNSAGLAPTSADYLDDGSSRLDYFDTVRPGTAGSAGASGAGSDDGDAKDGGKGGKNSKTYSFVALPGNAVKKRPRRRYDEIERLYRCRCVFCLPAGSRWRGLAALESGTDCRRCSFPNCTKAYGTLNHLNAHVTMQKHGSKRSPGGV